MKIKTYLLLFAALAVVSLSIFFGYNTFACTNCDFSYEIRVGGASWAASGTSITPRSGMLARTTAWSNSQDAYGDNPAGTTKIGTASDPYTCSAEGNVYVYWYFNEKDFGPAGAVSCFASNGDICTEATSYSYTFDGTSGACTSCNWRWNVGAGETSTTTCCGDDSASEFYLTRTCTSGCTTSAADAACCLASNKCVYSGTCYNNGWTGPGPWNSAHRAICNAGSWQLVEDCSAKVTIDSDGGNVPATAGTVTDYTTSSLDGLSCQSSAYADSCTSTIALTEYYNSVATYASQAYACANFEVAATETQGHNDTTRNGQCTAGTGAGCSANRFTTNAGLGGGTDACVGTCGTGVNSCVYRKYFSYDDSDSCSGLESCTYYDNNADKNSNTCNTCLGAGRWNLGGDLGINQCCGDDSSEVYTYFKDFGGAGCNVVTNEDCIRGSDNASDIACCNAATRCAIGATCYAQGTYRDTNADGRVDSGCDNGKWRHCDSASAACTAGCGKEWLAGGEAAAFGAYDSGTATECCGEVANEEIISQASSTDAPAGYNTGVHVCCSATNNCNYNLTCYDSGSTTARAIPNKAYCSNNQWVGGDVAASTVSCTAIAGAGKWKTTGWTGDITNPNNICCGDDSNEVLKDDTAVRGVNAKSCCNVGTDCVDSDGTCRPSNSGLTSFSSDNQYYCNAGVWTVVDSVQASCIANPAYKWYINKDAFFGVKTSCCGNDGAGDSFGRMDYTLNLCRNCRNGTDQGNTSCMPAGTRALGATRGLDTCLYDPLLRDADRSNDCRWNGCTLTTSTFNTIMTGVKDCQYGSPGSGGSYCLENNNTVRDNSTADKCYYNIACASLGVSGWSASTGTCHDPNYSPTLPMNSRCWYEIFGTTQNDRSDDCSATGCEGVRINTCVISVGQECQVEPSAGRTGCIATATKCNSDCRKLGYNNGTVVVGVCNCGPSNFTVDINSDNTHPLKSGVQTVKFNETATNADNRLDKEGDLIQVKACIDRSCLTMLDASYVCNGMDGSKKNVSCQKTVAPACDNRNTLFWVMITDTAGNKHSQISPKNYYSRLNEGCTCSSNLECYSNYIGTGNCDMSDTHCFNCINKTDSIDSACENDGGCGAALICDELPKNSCVSGTGWCNGTMGCGSSPSVLCNDELVLDNGNNNNMCSVRRNESTAHCGCVDNTDEGRTCDKNFDGNNGICADSNCVDYNNLVAQVNVGVVSGVGAEYQASCTGNENKPCVNRVGYRFIRNGTCAASNAGATTFVCEAVGAIAYNGVNYFNSCSYVPDGSLCDSNSSKYNTNNLFTADGRCSFGACCAGVYIDRNNNTVYDDANACVPYSQTTQGLLCDKTSIPSALWDGYVAYNTGTTSWECASTGTWSKYDALVGGSKEIVRSCVLGGVECLSGLNRNVAGYYQNGTCAYNNAGVFICDNSGHLVRDKISGNYYDSCSNPLTTLGSACDSSTVGGDFASNGICTSANLCCTGTYVDTNSNHLFDDTLACSLTQNALNKSNQGKLCDINQNSVWDGYVSYNNLTFAWECTTNQWSRFDLLTGDAGFKEIVRNCIKDGVECLSGIDRLNSYYQNGTCARNNASVQSCDNKGHIAQFSGRIYDSCGNVNVPPGSPCDSSVVGGDYVRDGICSNNYCCITPYVDYNNNKLFDDNLACSTQGALNKTNQGKLCDYTHDYVWDGYVAYNNLSLAWECVNKTYWSRYDRLTGDGGAKEVVKDCALGGVECLSGLNRNVAGYYQNGTCAINYTGSAICDNSGHVVKDRINGKYYSSCANPLTNLGSSCDSDATSGDYVHNGICTSANLCCLGVYVDTNSNHQFDDTLACSISQNSLNKTNQGKLCDIGRDFIWDGYVAFNNATLAWECVTTYWSRYDRLTGDGGSREVVKDCIIGGVECMKILNVSSNYIQTGTCAKDNAGILYCDTLDEISKHNGGYYDACANLLTVDGSQCDTSPIGGDFLQNGICTDGACCTSDFVDINNNTLFDDLAACGSQGAITLSNKGKLCDHNLDYVWDGYVAYNTITTSWECVNGTYWSIYDWLVFPGEEVLKNCIVGGTQCLSGLNRNVAGYYQNGTCSYNNAMLMVCDNVGHLARGKNDSKYYDSCSNIHVLDGSACDSSVLFGKFIQNGICSGLVCCTSSYVDVNDNAMFDDPTGCADQGQNSLVKANEGKLCSRNIVNTTWNGYVAFNETSGSWMCDIRGPWSTHLGNVAAGCIAQNTECDNAFNSLKNYTQDGLCSYDNSSKLVCDNIPEVALSNVNANYYTSCSNPNIDRSSFCDVILTDGIFSNNGMCIGGSCCSMLSPSSAYVDADNNGLFNDDTCGCSKAYQGWRCDKNFDRIWDGYCAYNLSLASWRCTNSTPMSFFDSIGGDSGSKEVTSGCKLGALGKVCDDTFSNLITFTQDGLCVFDDSYLSLLCDASGHAVFDSATMRYTRDCNIAANRIGGFACDPIVSNDDFSHNGYCADSLGTTVCYSGLVSANCPSGNCVIGTDQVSTQCTPGHACAVNYTTGFNFVQKGLCINSTYCDTLNETAFNGVTYFDRCLGHNRLECKRDSSIGGNYRKQGQCYSGSCDIWPPVISNIAVNLSAADWGKGRLNLTCMNGNDVGSGLNSSSYMFQYAVGFNPSEATWVNITECIDHTKTCIWDSQLYTSYADYASVRCRVYDNARQNSSWSKRSFRGLDSMAPSLILYLPIDGTSFTFPYVEFKYWINDSNTNTTLYKCIYWQYSDAGVLENKHTMMYPPKGNNTFSMLGFTTGTHKWHMSCYDFAENEVISSNRTFVIEEGESMIIEPIGETGIIRFNKSFTTTRIVNLVLNFNRYSDKCSFRNEVGTWSIPERCDMTKLWTLSEGPGIKTVYANISHFAPYDDKFTLLSASVFLDPTGKYIDVTPPVITAVSDYVNYSSDVNSLKIFVDAYDEESLYLGTSLRYSYDLIEETLGVPLTLVSDRTFTPDIDKTFTIVPSSVIGRQFTDGSKYTVRVRVANAINLTSTRLTDGVTYDTSAPSGLTILSTTHPKGAWTPRSDVAFTISGDSDISGYSVYLDRISTGTPDEFIDSNSGTLNYTSLSDGYYYLHVKAVDHVGNIGAVGTYDFGVDASVPSSPTVFDSPQRALGSSIQFCWTPSEDLESGIKTYHVQVYDWNANLVSSTQINDLCYSLSSNILSGVVYYAKVQSENNAGLMSAAVNIVDNLEITFLKPIDNAAGIALVDSPNPILVVQTSKRAMCGYNAHGLSADSSFVVRDGNFIYSDGIYHEVMLQDLEKGDYEIVVSCVDSYGNARVRSSLIKYDTVTPNNLVVDDVRSTLVSGQVFSMFAKVTGANNVGIGEIKKNRFKMNISGSDNRNILDEFILEDMGAGVYKMYFTVPSRTGNYTLSLSLDDGLTYSREISIVDVNFDVVYDFVNTNGEIVLSNLVAKDYENLKIGLAADFKNGIYGDDSLLKISTKTENGVIYFFATDKDAQLRRANDLLSKGGFLDLINPSFGDFINEEFTLNAELRFSNLQFNKISSITNGKYLLYVSNKGQDENNKTGLQISPR